MRANSSPRWRELRLRRPAEFDAVFRAGTRLNVPPFLCVVLWQQGAPSRLGLAVSARFGTAVERNLLKRWIRMVFRQTWPRFYAGWQVVVVPRAKAAQVGYQDVVRVFGKLSGLLAQQTLRTG